MITFDDSLRRDHHTALKPDFIKKRLVELITIAVKFFKRREKLPTICIFGRNDSFKLLTPVEEDYEERRLDCRCYPCDSNLDQILIRDKPQVIITIGNQSSFSSLIKAPFEIRKRWLHYKTMPDLTRVGTDAYNHYLVNMFNHKAADDNPLVTVFIPTFRTGEKIYRPLRSLKEQTYNNWEWIIVDDSDDDGKTFKMLTRLAKSDHRIQVFKPWEHSGVIGKLKNWACSLGNAISWSNLTMTMH